MISLMATSCRREYGAAEQSFRGFIEQYPSDRNIPLASYWLGESMYMQRKYSEAANLARYLQQVAANSTRAGRAVAPRPVACATRQERSRLRFARRGAFEVSESLANGEEERRE